MISVILIFASSLFFTGIINRTKSICSGRKGPSIMQMLRDLRKLFKKGSVYSETTSIIFQIAPIIYLSSLIAASMFIPFAGYRGVISFDGDFVFFAYLLALGKFFNIISALDTGSSFEGMGASREALYSLLAEPAFFILMGSFALLSGHSSFFEIFGYFHFNSTISYAVAGLATYVLIMIAMVENSRMPFDDPKTHLELTMINEVMILDNSGFDLGLILYSGSLKFAIYGALIANLFMNPFIHPAFSVLIFVVVQLFFAVVVGVLESFIARFRMNHNSQYILILSSASLLIFFGVMLLVGKIIIN
jgi:formate hydrogenlyase subunit 4